MFSLKYFNQDKDNLISTVFSELKILGVKVPKLKKFKLNVVKVEKSVSETGCKIFGVSLNDQEWVSDGEFLLPKFVAMSTAYLQRFSDKEEGLFRKAGNVARQKKLRVKLELGESLENSEPNDVASLLKQWLRELPEPLIPLYLQDVFVRCLNVEMEENRVTACLLTCLLLLPDRLHTLKHLLSFMANIASDSDRNKMSAYNLALIMAPNIFSLNESSDKSRNNLVQQHTSVVKLLIENCKKIGEIPAGITFQYPSSELDSSSDVLDSNANKSKKKYKSGQTQDIFSGLRKLVGQNGTPSVKASTPEHYLKTPSVPRSASKRKADSDLQSLLTVNNKMPALSLDDLDKTSLAVTPKLKGMFQNATEKVTSGHVRRKSIGALLRRKDRKRGKSSKLSSNDFELISHPDFTKVDKNTTENVLNSKLPIDKSSSTHSESEIVTQSGSIEKSVSDCYLPIVNTEFSVLPSITVSASQGCLPNRTLKPSSYHLRSDKLKNSPLGEGNFLDKDVKKKEAEIGRKRKSAEEETPVELSTKSIINPKIYKEECSSKDNNLCHSDITQESNHTNSNEFNLTNEKYVGSRKVFSNSRRMSPRLSTSANTSPAKVSKTESPKNTPKDMKSRLSPNTKSLHSSNVHSEETSSPRVSLTRQEAFIVKSMKNKRSNSNSHIKSSDSNKTGESKSDNSLPKKRNSTNSNLLQSTDDRSTDNKSNSTARKSLRGKTRHGSLIRGQPNSVKSGLRLTLPRHCSNDSSVQYNSPIPNLSIYGTAFKYDENSIIGSPRLESLDLSLSILLQNFCLSSPKDLSDFSLDTGVSSGKRCSTEKVNAHQKDSEKTPSQISLKTSETSENVTPHLRSRTRLSITSGNKTPKLKDLSEPSTAFSFSGTPEYKQKIRKSKRISSGSHCEKLLSPSNIKENESPKLSTEEGLNDSCFKTPNNKCCSPDSALWMSGNTFLSTIGSPQEEEVTNKRESIAMILKNNTGHVLAKVSLYDNQQSTGSSASEKETSQDGMFLRSSSQKCYSASRTKISNPRKCNSADRGSSVKSRIKYQRSPLPPPPKFTLTDLSTPSPKANHPLKEVTNLNVELEDSKLGESPNKFQKSNTPIKYAFSPLELAQNTPNSSPKAKKLKRNSFSGHTPYKLSKRVSRSESSPAYRRKDNVLRE